MDKVDPDQIMPNGNKPRPDKEIKKKGTGVLALTYCGSIGKELTNTRLRIGYQTK